MIGFEEHDPSQQLMVVLSTVTIGIASGIYLIQNKQSKTLTRQNIYIKDLVTNVETILRSAKELQDSKREHEEKELVHALIFTRSQLQVIENTLKQMEDDRIYRYSEIKDNWESVSEESFDKLDDIVKGSGDILNPEVKSQVSAIKGQLKSDLSEILQSHTALIEIREIIRLIDGLLSNQLSSHRLEILEQKRKSMEEYMIFGKSQGRPDSELSGMRLCYETEIGKYIMPDDETTNST